MINASLFLKDGIESVRDLVNDLSHSEKASIESQAILIVGYAAIKQSEINSLKNNENMDALASVVARLSDRIADLNKTINLTQARAATQANKKMTVLTKDQVRVALVEAWTVENPNHSSKDEMMAIREINRILYGIK